MKKFYYLTLIFFGINALNAQLQINNTFTPTQVTSLLFPNGLGSVSNIKFNGSATNAQFVFDQAAGFNTNFNPTNLGLSQGAILSTGKAIVALGPNNNAGNVTNPSVTPAYIDLDLAMLTTAQIVRSAALEFDFIAYDADLNVKYIFASEEYPEFVNSGFNDVVGIFISGPGISGPFSGNAQNIALIPNSTVPVAIDNLNNGLTNTGPCENCNYYVNNGTGSTPTINSSIQYDGFTTLLNALATLVPGETYHIKFAVANASDNAYDSAIFIDYHTFDFETDPCPPSQQCMYTFTLTDNGGDGLNGEYMSVLQNGITVAELYDDGSMQGPNYVFEVPLCVGQPFELIWNLGGEFPEQTGVSIEVQNTVIYNKPAGVGAQGTILYSGIGCDIPLKTDDFKATTFAIVPNPAKTDFKITTSRDQKITTVHLYNNLGNLIRRINSSFDRIDVSNLSQGVYFVNIATDDGMSETKKLIVD